MSDISLRFSPFDLLVIAYALAMPLLAGLVLGVRALCHGGRVRWLGLAGLGCLAAIAGDLMLVRGDVGVDGIGAVGRGVLLAGLAGCWVASALIARARLWMDAGVVVVPAILAGGLIWLEHG